MILVTLNFLDINDYKMSSRLNIEVTLRNPPKNIILLIKLTFFIFHSVLKNSTKTASWDKILLLWGCQIFVQLTLLDNSCKCILRRNATFFLKVLFCIKHIQDITCNDLKIHKRRATSFVQSLNSIQMT